MKNMSKIRNLQMRVLKILNVFHLLIGNFLKVTLLHYFHWNNEIANVLHMHL